MLKRYSIALKLLHVCPHTTIYMSSYCCGCALIGDLEALLQRILLLLGVQAPLSDSEVVDIVLRAGGGHTLGGGGLTGFEAGLIVLF